jgi:parvulin-like peptidyl-prolyl isomerase
MDHYLNTYVRVFLLPILLLITHSLLAQSDTKGLVRIRDEEQAIQFMKAHPELHAEIVTVSSDKDSSALTDRLLSDGNKSGMKLFGDSTYKIFDYKYEPVYRASYIYLNGASTPKYMIDSLRDVIINSYESGTPFTNLVTQYNMDGNRNGGDLGWARDGELVKEFEDAVKSHQKGDIFKVDVPYNNWYYVVLKTHDNTHITTVKALKLKTQ